MLAPLRRSSLKNLWQRQAKGLSHLGYKLPRLRGGAGAFACVAAGRRFLPQAPLKLIAICFIAFATIFAQGITNYLTPGVARVGAKLACRCSGCKNTVGDCPMLRCDYTDPMRHRIFDMQAKGMSDSAIVSTIVREEGVAALAGQQPLGLWVWLMPGLALAIGFWIYSRYVRRNRKQPEPLTAGDQAIIDRFQSQIDRELDESPAQAKNGGERK